MYSTNTQIGKFKLKAVSSALEVVPLLSQKNLHFYRIMLFPCYLTPYLKFSLFFFFSVDIYINNDDDDSTNYSNDYANLKKNVYMYSRN